jgi:hypothetical protein
LCHRNGYGLADQVIKTEPKVAPYRQIRAGNVKAPNGRLFQGTSKKSLLVGRPGVNLSGPPAMEPGNSFGGADLLCRVGKRRIKQRPRQSPRNISF